MKLPRDRTEKKSIELSLGQGKEGEPEKRKTNNKPLTREA